MSGGDEDALVGLRFEVGGGLGRMAGRVVGKVGALYLVQKAGNEHLELLELDDLRSAKFYPDLPAPAAAAPAPDKPAPSPTAPAKAEETPARRKLSDQIRRPLGGGEST